MMTQQDRSLASAPTIERRGKVGFAFGQVVNTTKPQRLAAVMDAHAAVHQHGGAVLFEKRPPQRDIRPKEVIMIARHGIHAIARLQLLQRTAKQQDLTIARIDQIAAEQNQVWLLLLHSAK